MSFSVTYGGVDVTSRIRFPEGTEGFTSNADGQFEAAAVQLDNGDGALTIVAWQPLIATETDCSNPRVWTGYLYQQTSTRGAFRVGSSRFVDCEMSDLNVLLNMQPLHGATAKRPAETGTQRLAWLLASEALAGIVYDNGFVDSIPDNFDEADYTDQYAPSVLADLCVSSVTDIGRIFFVYADPTTQQPSLFIKVPTVAVRDSTLRISNVLADADSVTFAPSEDSNVVGTAEDIYCGVRFKYKTGEVFAHNTATHNTYFSNGFHRIAVYETTRVGSVDTATRHAASFLHLHAGQIDTISCSITLPSTQVNLLTEGMRVQVKFSHLPGYSAFTYMRVARRTVRLNAQADTTLHYDVALELSLKGFTAIPGGGTGGFPAPPPANASVVQHAKISLPAGGTNNITLPQTPTEGDVFVLQVGRRGGGALMHSAFTASPDGTTTPGSDGGAIGYRTVLAGETTSIQVRDPANNGVAQTYLIAELTGVDMTQTAHSEADVDTGTKPSSVDAGTLTIPGAGIAVQGEVVHCSDWAGNGPTSIIVQPPWTELEQKAILVNGDEHPLVWLGSQSFSAAASPSTVQALSGGPYNFGGYGGQTLFFASTAGVTPPLSGQQFGPVLPVETPNGVTTTFTLPAGYEFADGSLRVYVDRLDQTAAVLSYDGAARTFTLGFAPKTGELVEVYAQGR